MNKYHVASPAAIVGGTAAAGGAVALLVRDAAVTGWTVDLMLMPVLVGLTILCGHHTSKALFRGRVLSAAGLAILAVFGSTLTVYETMGRRAEVRDAKVAVATDSASQRSHLQQMLAEAEENVTRYRKRLSDECGSGKGKKCDGFAYTVKTWEAAVTGYKAEISSLGAPKPIDPKAERVAAIAAMFGVGISPDVIQRHVGVLEPLALPIFLELGSIILFGYGLGRGRKIEAPAPTRQPLPEIEVANDPLPLSTSSTPAYTRDEALADLATLVRAGQHPESQDWLAERWGRTKGCTSKWLMHWEATGQMPGNRQPDGRRKMVVGR